MSIQIKMPKKELIEESMNLLLEINILIFLIVTPLMMLAVFLLVIKALITIWG